MCAYTYTGDCSCVRIFRSMMRAPCVLKLLLRYVRPLLLCLLGLEGRKHIFVGELFTSVLGCAAIATSLNIATSTAHHIYSLFDRTGSVESQSSV